MVDPYGVGGIHMSI